MPSFVTNENVLFNGTTTPAVVLSSSAGVKKLIRWNSLSAADQDLLTSFINANGGATPLVADTAGKLTLQFGGTLVGGNATGLSTVAAATAGKATINLGGSAVAGNPSGLPNVTGTNGYQIVNYQPGVASSTSTGIVAATAGYQIAEFSSAKSGASATGLANDATVYTATITVDGSLKSITTAGSAAQTFTALLSVINTALGASATAAIVGGNIKVTSASTGIASTVRITTGNLFSSLTGFNVIKAAVDGAGSNANLTATIVVDGVSKSVSVAPGSVATFGAVVTALNAALGVAGTAAIVGGDIRITSATTGKTSTVVITPGTLFPILAGYVSVLPPAGGGGDVKRYGCTITIDGTIIKTVSFTGVEGNTFQHVVDELNTDLGGAATAAITGGNIVITSATTGAASSVSIYDNAFMTTKLTGFVGITNVKGTSPVVYTLRVTVDGVEIPVTLSGSQVGTYTSMLARINTVLGSAATAAITGGNIVITSATTGVASTVTNPSGTLLTAISSYAGHTSVPGASDMLDAMAKTKAPNGAPLSSLFKIETVGTKPAVPHNVKHTLSFTYWDGSVWKYLDDDTAV